MNFWTPHPSLSGGKYQEAVAIGHDSPASEAVDFKMHVLRAWELPSLQCMLAIAASHRLKNPKYSRIDVDAVRFRCRLLHHDPSLSLEIN